MVESFSDLDPEVLESIEAAVRREVEDREHRSPTSYFPWHSIQEWLLEAPELCKHPVRVILAAGGNRGGKSAVAKGIYSQYLRRESPLTRQLRTLDKFTGQIRTKHDRDPYTVWIAPPTLEKARQDWINPSDGYSLKHWAGDLFLKHERQPDNQILTRPPGFERDECVLPDGKLVYENCDKTLIKSQDQALETFESSSVDLCIFDEEVQDEAKWNSVLMRIGTTNGTIVMAFTPLHGLSWSYDRYWKPNIKMKRATKVGERRWIYDPERDATIIFAQMGSRDNPQAREYADEVENDPRMSEAEKNARLYGEYGYVEGALLRKLSGLDIENPDPDQAIYVVDALPGQRHHGERIPGRLVNWWLVADPNKSYGALLAAQDKAGNLFFVAEHLEESWPNRLHAKAFREMEKKHATGLVQKYADPGSAGAQAIVDLADLGLFFVPMPKGAGSVAQSIKTLRGMTWIDPMHHHPITGDRGAPRVYFYRPGLLNEKLDDKGRRHLVCHLAEQLSSARQTDNESAAPDTPHKDIRSKLDLFDCARYIAVLATMALQEEPDEEYSEFAPDPDLIPDEFGLTGRTSDDDIAHGLDTPIWTPDYDFS